MAGLSVEGRNLMLDSGFAPAYASLHSADAGASGDNELLGGSPAYARVALAWGSAASGVRSTSAPVVFDVPAAATIVEVGYWSAPTGGTFYGSRAVTQEDFAGQGTYTIAAGDIDEGVA